MTNQIKDFQIPKSIYSEIDRLQAHNDRKLVRGDIDRWVYQASARTGAIWGGSAFALSFAFHKGYGPASIIAKYHRVPLAYRFLLPVLGTLYSSPLIPSHNCRILHPEADRAFAMRYAINRDLVEESTLKKQIQDDLPFDLTQEGIRVSFLRNKYAIVAGLWLGTVALTLLVNFKRSDIQFSQKIINMRLTGQTAALIGLGCVAFVNTLGEEVEGHPFTDAHFEAIIERQQANGKKKNE